MIVTPQPKVKADAVRPTTESPMPGIGGVDSLGHNRATPRIFRQRRETVGTHRAGALRPGQIERQDHV